LKRILSAVSIALLLAVSAAAESGHPSEAGADRETLWKVANFVVLAGLIGYFIKKKAGGFFASRTEEIRRGLEESARLVKDAEARYAEMDERLANIGVEIESLRKQARHEFDAESARVRAEIERDLKNVRAQAEQEINSAVKVAGKELRAYAAGVAVDLAATRIRARLTPDAENALVIGMLKDLEQRPAAQAVRAS
jgi:F-type H+-transporting ATPase subunit b